ncbi:MAG TPA: DNA sulfur modification protein DndD [Pyrinomonadaceae bacterium]|jgi:DNA sulfur modification protein DndD
MFLEEVTICNVGLFRNSHTLQLAPPSPRQPVILIGGLNGSGKTTLLDSIQLALYGKRARCSNRGSLSYDEYLRRSVNSGVKPGEEASVTLQFRQWSDGREHTYRVRRAWSANGNGVAEHVVVNRDNSFDKVLTEIWSEFVEELIPVEISQLFFFDGEKIESFADLETSTQLLAKAVHSLLGLDVVNRLTADLIALERRKQIALKTDVEQQKIAAARNELAGLDGQLENLAAERAARQNDVDRRRKDLREAQDNYSKRGGALFDQREVFEDERGKLQEELRRVERALRDCAEGVAPLLLVRDLLSALAEQHAREESAKGATIVNQVLAERDKQLLAVVKSQEIGGDALKALQRFLSDDRKQRTAISAQVERYLNLTPEGVQDARNLKTMLLPQTQVQVNDLLCSAEQLQSRLVDLERKLAGVPAEDLVAELIKRRDIAQAALTEAELSLTNIDAELKRLSDERGRKHAEMVISIEKAVEVEFQAEAVERIVLHSQRVRGTMVKFRNSVVERHASRIAALVLDSFRRLLRKESLISDLKIDAETFALKLHDREGRSLSPDRLSAGERQLLAVSLLWGLARASGRPLPVVIDTPLGRLDASHRSRLVENYFPHASHQVLLLSTDKEIEGEYFEQLKPFVGYAYHLEYDDRLGSTQVKPGYFW